jgi:hypothetical protein
LLENSWKIEILLAVFNFLRFVATWQPPYFF